MGTLDDRLRDEYGTPAAAKRHDTIFLAHEDEVAEALQTGWTVKQIWKRMSKDGAITMSYVHFCRLVKQHITSKVERADGEVPPPGAAPEPSSSPANAGTDASAQPPNPPPEKELTKTAPLDLLREEAFKSVRSPKPTGPLIGKPKSREEENRELFGEQ